MWILLDRWLAAGVLEHPEQWNAVAGDDANRSGRVEDQRRAGAPWRQASILPVGDSRLAVVTVSDLFTSRVTFLTEQYDVVGMLARTTSDPALVTDEARGYKPLSHIWPIVKQDGRLQTLITFTPLRSGPAMMGLFAYVALGGHDNELLFVCRLQTGPGPTWGELMRADLNGDGVDDFVVYPKGERGAPPIATFVWNPRRREYTVTMTDEGRKLVAWWSATPADRVTVRRETPIDDAVLRVAARFGR